MNITNLTHREIEIIQSALQLATPTGGGSEIFSLSRKICEQTQIVANDGLTLAYWDVAYSEYRQSMS